MTGKTTLLFVAAMVASTLVMQGDLVPASNNELAIELITTYGSVSETDKSAPIIGLIWYPTIDQDGNIYFLDFQAMEIVSFSNNGELRWRVGSPGEGPGELVWPHGLIWDGENLVLLNHRGARIDRLDSDGNWLQPLHPSTPTTGVTIAGILNDSVVVTRGFRPGVVGATYILRRKLDWEAVDTFMVDYSGEVDGLTGMLHLTPPTNIYDDHVAVGSYSTDAFYLYGDNGELLRTVTPDRHRLLRPIVWESEGAKMVVKFNIVYPPIRIGPDLSLLRYSLPPKGVNRESATPGVERRIGEEYHADFYDDAGTLVASYGGDTPEGNLLRGAVFAAQGDFVYVSKSRPVPHLAKLRIRRTE